MRLISRIGLIGDVHGEHAVLGEALSFLAGCRLDTVACVGDLVDGDGDSDRVCELLAMFDVDTVSGNHDRWFLAGTHRHLPRATLDATAFTRRFLSQLPPTVEYATPKGHLLVGHGVAEDDEIEFRFDTPLDSVPALARLQARTSLRCVVGGHTHVPMIRALDRVTFVNVGTLRRTRPQRVVVLDFQAATPARLEWHDGEAADVNTNIPVACDAAVDRESWFHIAFYRHVHEHGFRLECEGWA